MEKIIDTFTPNICKAEAAILMPVHNEEDVIEKVVTEYYDVISYTMPVEVVLSEDGSTDNTKNIIEALSKKIPLKALMAPQRKGYALSIIDGLKHVVSDYVLITDSDGQHDPKDFWKLWEIRKYYDVISGFRIERADSTFRKIMSSTFKFMANKFFNMPFKDATAPFKLMRTEVARQIANECRYMKESFWMEFTIRAYKRGLKIIEVPVIHRARMSGSTRVYKPLKIPKITISQIYSLMKLWFELK
ncbi:MAG: glycosyltransferase family 2 protein [Candidatus Methanomethylicia archaeon]